MTIFHDRRSAALKELSGSTSDAVVSLPVLTAQDSAADNYPPDQMSRQSIPLTRPLRSRT
ncbi:MAG TPA: hypothetical protein VGF75_06695 [Candidatus Saccharimonadales bacterium]